MENKKLRILVGCEESQAVTIALRKLGHEAFSCDLLPCSGGHPEWHIKADIFTVIHGGYFTTEDGHIELADFWDKKICFPSCTHLTLAGAKHFENKRLSGAQEENIRFFFEVWKVSNCVENPIGIMNGGKYIKEWFPKIYKEMLDYGFPFIPTQMIQPYEFGDPVKKTTCLWLKGLPKLKGTKNVENEVKYYVSAKGAKMSEWYAKQIIVDGKKYGYGSDEFKKHRSKTFQGIADAMAYQWTNTTNNELTLF